MASSDSDPSGYPIVGITAAVDTATWGVWTRPAVVSSRTYADCVAAAGGIPAVLPATLPPGDVDRAADRVIASMDAIVIAGGTDIDPAHYGEEPHREAAGPDAERDTWELALLAAAARRSLPVLAICRGAQLLNVARGGSLHQHLPDVVGTNAHRPAPGCFAPVAVTVEPGSRLASIVGTDAKVSCCHHQAIARLGDGLVATARAADGTIEGIEGTAAEFVVGVQWHPEEEREDRRLFAALIAAARI